MLERLRSWRSAVPELAIRSSFVVGFPGETEEDFAYLLAWLQEAQLDRVGAFKFEPVEGAPATSMDKQVPEALKQERYEAVMALSAQISAEKLAAKVGSTVDVLIDASFTIANVAGKPSRPDKRDQNQLLLEWDGRRWLFLSGM